MTIATPQEYLSMWIATWTQDLNANLAAQDELKLDEQKIRNLLDTCAAASALLFPAPPVPPPEAPTDPTTTV